MSWFTMILIIGAIIFVLVLFFMAINPVYDVWASRKKGLADLAEAENAEKVAIMRANARLSAAKANKEAEIISAESVSESIEKIGNALQANEGYLRWQWIKSLSTTRNEKIYIPTEANLPILEARDK